MTDREGGYIKAHRQWESSAAVKALTAEGEVVWLRLLFATNWKDTEVILRDGPRVIRRGQALISERRLAERARVGRQVVRNALRVLTLSGSIQVEQVQPIGQPKANLITVLKYEAFQGDDGDRQPKGQPAANPTPSQPQPDQKKGKKGKKEKKIDRSSLRGASDEATPLLSTVPALPPDAPPLATWLVMNYPDVPDPVTFAREVGEAFPMLDVLQEAREALLWERSDPGHTKTRHRQFLLNWMKNSRERAQRNGVPRPTFVPGPFASP